MAYPRFIEALRALLPPRWRNARSTARANAAQRDLQRKQMVMAQLAQTLQSGRRNGGGPSSWPGG